MINSLIEAQALALHNRLVKTDLRVAIAESCTGGLLGASITANPGSSRYFLGGVIAYHDSVKKALLAVNSSTLDKHGAVSGACVKELLTGLYTHFSADYMLAVSGIAGPTGSTETKAVGTVYVGLQFGQETVLVNRYFFPGNRVQIQEASVLEALKLLYAQLDKAQT